MFSFYISEKQEQKNHNYSPGQDGITIEHLNNTFLYNKHTFLGVFLDMATWFGSTVPLNRTEILTTVPQKTTAEYAMLRDMTKQTIRSAKGGHSEYVDRFALSTKLEPIMNT